jgi:DNA (cytosine-5)-methyltransferase 1
MPDQLHLSFSPFEPGSLGDLSAATSLEPMPAPHASPLRAAEFFAGIGLVRMALERSGIQTVWANDIEPIKQRIYEENFGSADFQLGDVTNVCGSDVPSVDVATASFPCTDLSLAGWRRGLAGAGSGMFWQFTRVLDEMGERRPQVILLENVPGFATSHGGADLRAAVERLNELGYWCDLLQVDARRFVPQSRPRMFVVGMRERIADAAFRVDSVRPRHLVDFMTNNSDLMLQSPPLPAPSESETEFSAVVERFDSSDPFWWDAARTTKFLTSLVSLQDERVRGLRSSSALTWRTAYRRTRAGVAVWEVRTDAIAGCLRTARGGSSKQAVVEAGKGEVRVRWMTAREYARLQGVPDSFRFDSVSENQAMFGFGDAVCVPVVEWVARHYLRAVALTPAARAS